MVAHVTSPAAPLLEDLPSWVTLVRAGNPGPMTLDGTNTWVLRAPGSPDCVVVDPGPDDPAHLRAVAAHGPVAAVLVTHGHPDHVAGLDRFLRMGGSPEVWSAGTATSAGTVAGLRITPLATPGHTADSVSFLAGVGDERAAGVGDERVVLTGDTVLGTGTTIVAWPDGDLGEYLLSLERLAALGPLPVLPGHGPALADCAAAARFYHRHRLARLAQVRAAVAAGATTPAEVVERVYADVAAPLREAAEWSVRAQLAYLGGDAVESEIGQWEHPPPAAGLERP